MPQIAQVLALAAVTFGTGAATVTVLNEDIPDLDVPEMAWSPGTELDGMTFNIVATDVGNGAVFEGEVLFRDGGFQSTDCQEYCDFGWDDYQTTVIDGVTHFTASSLCADAPHTVVWYGQVEGDTLTLDMTWTTRRWYWTNQFAGTATGTVAPPAVSG